MKTEFRLMPEQASTFASQVDALYFFLLLISSILSVGIAATIVYFAIKYRHDSKADRSPTQFSFFWIELSWIAGPLILTMVLFIWGAQLYSVQRHPAEDAMVINCVARQWMWKFQHPDGRSEINDLHVPLNQPIRINMISDDVIHSLYLPAFRVKYDVLPGRYTSVWFNATQAGEYHLFCAEYCGAKHSGMRGTIHVLEPSLYQQWLEGRNATEDVTKSERLFDQMRCYSCHSGGGQGSRGPALQNLLGMKVPLQNGTTVVADENYLRESILRPDAKIVAGYDAIMPSYDGQVTEEGILQLIAEIKAMGLTAPREEGRIGAVPAKIIGPDQAPVQPIPRDSDKSLPK